MEKMKNNKLRQITVGALLAFALLISVCLAVLPMTVSAAEGEPTIVATEAELTAALAAGGSIQLGADITLATDCKLTVPEGASLTVPEGMTLTAQGGVENNGSIVVNGTIVLPANMVSNQVTALGITGTGGIKFGNAHIGTDGDCITHNWDARIKQKDTTQHYTMGCRTCNINDEATVAACEYDDACDENCNVCRIVRTIEHQYDANGFCTVCRYSDTPAVDSDGDGYVEIDSAGKLWWFTHQVKDGQNALNAELTANVDLSGTCGDGIGNWLPISHEDGYAGNFNGQGFTVSNVYIASDEQYAGLFGYVNGATIENVCVTGSVSSTFYWTYDPDTYENFDGAVGGVVAQLDGGTIRNCESDVTVTGGFEFGGICGRLSSGIIEDCINRGTIIRDLDSTDSVYYGGIVGYMQGGTVRGCTNQGEDIVGTYADIGGIVGLLSEGTVEKCINLSNIAGTQYTSAGGIAGRIWIYATIRNCGNYGTVTGVGVGGITGYNEGIIEHCWNIADVSGTEYVGPIAGLDREGYGTSTNNYYLNGTTTEDGGRTAEQFASGQVAYELNGSTTTDESVWKQTLGTDNYPTLAGDNVYYVASKKCDGTVIDHLYSNSSNDVVVHEDTDNDSFCDLCGWLIITEITFPDANFRSYIAENIDTDKDGMLSPEEIAAVTEIDVSIEASYSYTYISDLTGIEYFTNLLTLDASRTKIASIDVSMFTNLEFLYLYNCYYLKDLDLTANTNLIDLDVSGTELTELDLSNNSNAGLNMGENTSVVTLEHCGVGYVDMSQFADLSRMTIVSGGTLGEDGWLKLDEGATKIVYEYDTKSNPQIAAYFYVEVYINSNNVTHTYVDAAVSKDETGHYAQSCSTCRTVNEESVVAHTIKYNYTTKYTDSQHREYCKNCDYLITEACNYASDCEENCSECRLTTRIFFWEEHTLIYTTYIDGDDDSSNDCHDVRCANCSSLNYASEFCYYAFACSETCVCGRANPNSEAHTPKYAVNGNMTHDSSCEVCAKQIADDAACTDGDGDLACDVCAGFMFPGTGTEADPYQVDTFNELVAACIDNAFVKLVGDIEWSRGGNVIISGTTHLCLNGHTLNLANSNTRVLTDGVLTLCNCSENAGTITAYVIPIFNYGTLVLSGNPVITNDPKLSGGNGAVAMYSGGKIDAAGYTGGDVTMELIRTTLGDVIVENVTEANGDKFVVTNRDCALELTDEGTLVMAKATPTADIFDFTPPANLDACDGLAKEATVTVKEGIEGVGSVTIKYFKGETELTGAPTTVGTYTVKIEVAEGANFFKSEKLLTDEAWTFTFDITDEAAHTGVTLVSNGNETHDTVCTVCEKVFEDDATCVYAETVDDAYVAIPATCISGTTYFKSCDCGHKSTETFVAGSLDSTNHDWNTTDVCSRCNAVKISEKTFPDEKFRNFILGDFLSPLNEDEILTSEELQMVKRIAIDVDYISDLTGVEYFTELTTLTCYGFQCLKPVDLSQNTKLTEVDFGLQLWHITIAPDATFDLNTLGIDVSKLTLPEGCTVNNGIIKFGAGVYDLGGLTYPSGYGDTLFEVRLAIENPHTHASVETFDDCSKEEVCLCGDITKAAKAHTPEDDDDDCTTDILCSVCDAVTTKGNEAHTGGTATCTAKAECTVCGTKYGSTLAHSPEADDGNCMTEVKCSVCQTVTTPANAAHTGGTATCQAQANCSVCETAYGETNANNHSKTTFVYTANADGTTHTKKYECCGVVALDSEGHTYGTDNKCVCGAEKPIPTYTVTVENGTVSDGSTSVVVNENGSVTVTANAAPAGKQFKGWSVNGTVVSTEQSYTFNAAADTTITAVYVDIPDNNLLPEPEVPNGLSTGAIVAIVIACVAVLGGGGFALYWFVFKKKKLI